jgi:alpha,alpha-trehalose phosphorylase
MLKDLTAVRAIYPDHEWEIVEEEFKPQYNLRNETIFALGNGYLGLRGNLEEGWSGPPGDTIEGTYINGFYESEPIPYGEIAYGYAERSQTMLNVTNGKVIRLFVGDEEFRMQNGAVSEYRRTLNLQTGILTRSLVWRSPRGKTVRLRIARLVALGQKHLAAIRYEVTPLDCDGTIRLVSLLDGDVGNLTATDDPRAGSSLTVRALQLQSKRTDGTYLELMQRTRNTGFSVMAAAEHCLTTESGYTLAAVDGRVATGVEFAIEARAGVPIRLEKYLAYATTRDLPEEGLSEFGRALLDRAKGGGFAALREQQRQLLEAFWSKADVTIVGEPGIQQGIRYNIFQLLQSAGRDGKTNIAAKGLSGEGYEGHYFWDSEMYVVPFFLYHHPGISRKLLEYRYRILDQARRRARQMAHPKGALFPWRTIDGEECSAYYPAGTAQYHINADIAYAIRQYMQATGDWEFLKEYGAEILFETARIWADLGEYIPQRGNRFCINCVTGPDEYSALVNNNCYTNLMARAHLEYACDTAAWLRQNAPAAYQSLAARIDLAEEEIDAWREAARRMLIPFDEASGLYLQDDSFMDRAPWDFANTPAENYPLLVHYHPLVIYRHQVCKQADLVMALFLLGELFTPEEKRRNFDFYERVTTHDSSLSPCIFSIVASDIGDVAKAYRYFMATARMDLDDLHGNTHQGIHVANMAGAWLCLVQGFAGMRTANGVLSFNPRLPEPWREYGFKIAFQGRLIQVRVDRRGAMLTLLEGEEMTVMLQGETVLLQKEIRGFIFDLDGVLTDSSEYHYRAWQRLADEEGLPFSRKENEQLRGIPRRESLLIVLKGRKYSEAQLAELMERKNRYYQELIQRITPRDMLPGVAELLAELRAAGLKLALGSSSKNAAEVLRRLGIDAMFDAISDGHSVSHAKPAPDLFLDAAAKLGLPAAACVVVEDAAAGIQAARSGGFLSVGLGPVTRVAGADAIFPDLKGIRLADILAALKAL